mgnify:CR=1 FL=1
MLSESDPLSHSINDLKAVIEKDIDQAEAQRHLTTEVANAMAMAGLYRVAVPRSLGGLEAHPINQIKTIEAISAIHGSTGWNLMIGIETMGILCAFYEPASLQALYSDPNLIISGSVNPVGKATKVPGGYKVSGQWPFVSGIHNAAYFWCQSIVQESGKPLKDARGYVFCESLIPVRGLEIIDTWQVSGMRASGSHDALVKEVFVEDKFVCRMQTQTPTAPGPLYQMPIYSRLAYNKVGVATGITMKAIKSFVELATQKKPRGSANLLKDRVEAQNAVADAERILGSARSYVFEQVTDIWDTVENGDLPTDRQKALLQLACSGAANETVAAIEKLVSAAGASANFISNPLERCLRDIGVVRQHIMVSPQHNPAIGRVLLGMESGSILL